jgi:hypothetical protein
MGAEVGEEGEKGEEQGKDILAFGNPRDRFDAEGVHGPKEREEKGGKDSGLRTPDSGRRGTKKTGQVEEKEEKEDGVGGMEGDVDGVEGGRIVNGGSEERDIGHVGNPKKGHVHADIGGGCGESPAQGGKGEAGMDEGVAHDVGGVVEVHEIVSDGGGEECEDKSKEEEGGRRNGEAAGKRGEKTKKRFHDGGMCNRADGGTEESKMAIIGVFFRGDGSTEDFAVGQGSSVEGEAGTHGGDGRR